MLRVLRGQSRSAPGRGPLKQGPGPQPRRTPRPTSQGRKTEVWEGPVTQPSPNHDVTSQQEAGLRQYPERCRLQPKHGSTSREAWPPCAQPELLFLNHRGSSLLSRLQLKDRAGEVWASCDVSLKFRLQPVGGPWSLAGAQTAFLPRPPKVASLSNSCPRSGWHHPPVSTGLRARAPAQGRSHGWPWPPAELGVTAGGSQP